MAAAPSSLRRGDHPDSYAPERSRIRPARRRRVEVASDDRRASKPGCASPPTRLHEQAATLTALDQAIGDGDHGINMDRGFTAIVATLDA